MVDISKVGRVDKLDCSITGGGSILHSVCVCFFNLFIVILCFLYIPSQGKNQTWPIIQEKEWGQVGLHWS